MTQVFKILVVTLAVSVLLASALPSAKPRKDDSSSEHELRHDVRDLEDHPHEAHHDLKEIHSDFDHPKPTMLALHQKGTQARSVMGRSNLRVQINTRIRRGRNLQRSTLERRTSGFIKEIPRRPIRSAMSERSSRNPKSAPHETWPSSLNAMN